MHVSTESPLERLAYQAEPGPVARFRNMFCIPLLAAGRFPEHPSTYFPFGRATNNGDLVITEKPQPEIEALLVDNRGEMPVMIPAGTQIPGLAQNRMVRASVVLAGHTSGELPVRCTQADRWEVDSPREVLSDGDATSIASSFVGCGSIDVSQQDVWADVLRVKRLTGTHLASQSLHDIELHIAPTVTEYVDALLPADDRLVGMCLGMPINRDGCYHIVLQLFGVPALAAAYKCGMVESVAKSAAAYYPTLPAQIPDAHDLDLWPGQIIGSLIRNAPDLVAEPIKVNRGTSQTGESSTGKKLSVLTDLERPLHLRIQVR